MGFLLHHWGLSSKSCWFQSQFNPYTQWFSFRSFFSLYLNEAFSIRALFFSSFHLFRDELLLDLKRGFLLKSLELSPRFMDYTFITRNHVIYASFFHLYLIGTFPYKSLEAMVNRYMILYFSSFFVCIGLVDLGLTSGAKQG